jgi:hypothetical protein
MKSQLYHRFALLLVWFTFLVACAVTTKPQSAEDYVQTARAQLGAVYQTIGDLKAQGAITQAVSQTAIVKAEAAEAQLELASTALGKGDTTSAQQIAGAALAVLVDIQAALPKPKGK